MINCRLSTGHTLPTPTYKSKPCNTGGGGSDVSSLAVLLEEGKFGRYGGKFVPETLISCLSQLEAEFGSIAHDAGFQVCGSVIFETFFTCIGHLCMPRVTDLIHAE